MPDKKISREEIDEIYDQLRLACQYLEFMTKVKNQMIHTIREIQEILIDLEDIQE